jgi:ATP-dependent exoDNAse (exonuclease V) beta subunit
MDPIARRHRSSSDDDIELRGVSSVQCIVSGATVVGRFVFSAQVVEETLAEAVRGWIDDESLDASEIAVLVSKQQNLHGQKLRAALDARGVPFRDEDQDQNLASEPVANLIVNFLLVAAGHRQPAPYRRLLDLLVFGRGLDQEREYQARSRRDRFIANIRQKIATGEAEFADLDDLQAIVNELLGIVGHDAVVELSTDYAQRDYLQQQIEATIGRAHALLSGGQDAAAALASFSGDRALRIMSIHKSKGLEFDTVVVLA